MPVIVDSYEPDGDGGYYIEWSDPSQPVTAHIHATPELMDEFGVHHRVNRGAPTARLAKAQDGMRDKNLSDRATVERFRSAYEELIDDIKDLKERGLKHNTPHTEHVHIRQGMKPDRAHLKDSRPDGYKQFIEGRRAGESSW